MKQKLQITRHRSIDESANLHLRCLQRTARFALDAAGRPTKKLSLPIPQPTNVTAVTPSYDADNRMATLLGYGLPHDLDGNLEATILPLPWLPVAQLYWDTRNRLTDVWEEVWDGNTFLYYYQSQYTYDAEGHRTHQSINGVTTRYTVNPHGLSGMSEVLVEHKPDATKRRYIWGGPAGLLYETQSNSSGTETAVRYYHSDQVGSTLALTDASATVTARLEYSPYGVITHGTGVVDTPFRYNGARGVMTDFETGLIHMRARYYHPLVGRFLNEDPIGFDGGMNWYAFANGDPVMQMDPSGLVGSGVVVTSAGWYDGWTGQSGTYTGAGTPFAPFDGLNPSLGGISTPEVRQSGYFEQFWPGELQNLKGFLTSQTAEAVRQGYNSGTEPALPSMSYTFTQNFLEQNLVLGDVGASVQNLNVTWSPPANGRQTYTFTAQMVVSDGLGYNLGGMFNEDIAYYTLGSGGIALFPERSVVRGRWDIQGGGAVRSTGSH